MLPDHTTRRIALVLLRPVTAARGRIAARLDAQDAAARSYGWTVESGPFGGRCYRDPRFDQYRAVTAGRRAD